MTRDELAAKAAAIKAEWERKAANGDQRARQLLRDLYPEDYAQIDAAAEVLARPATTHWADREPGEEG